ncbi:MAG: chorismate mutase [Caldilineaceae bacterium]|nr:chorismate mutase [Caldilineaceae bacterium]
MSMLKSPAECSSIEEVRAAIDSLDREIVQAIGLRAQYVKTITRFKKTEQDVRAPARRQQVLNARRAWAEEAGIDPDVVERLYILLIDHFVAEEMRDLRLAPADQA